MIPKFPNEEYLEKHNLEVIDFRTLRKGDRTHFQNIETCEILFEYGPTTADRDWPSLPPRWIFRTKTPKLTEGDIPLCAVIRKKDLKPNVMEKAIGAIVRYANSGKLNNEYSALDDAFSWCDSSEGWGFWDQVDSAPDRLTFTPWNAETFPKDKPVYIKKKSIGHFLCGTIIGDFGSHGVSTASEFIDYKRLLEEYLQYDGKPCGVKV